MELKNQRKTDRLINPNWSKSQTIIYFLWLDDQVMAYWSLYLDMKCQLPFGDFWTAPDTKTLSGYLQIIEHFEGYQKEILEIYTYHDIDQFIKDNPDICKNFNFFRFFY